MSSVRNWEPERSEKRALTQKAKTNREKPQLSSIPLKQTKNEQKLSVFCKQAGSSFYPSQQKCNQSSMYIKTHEQPTDEQPNQTCQKNSHPLTISKANPNPSITTSKVILTSKSKPLEESKIIQEQLRRLEDIKVEYKKIQEVEDERRRREDAQGFVARLKREKREFEGKLYLIKRDQEQKKKKRYFEEIAQKVEERQMKRLQRVKEAQRRLEQFRTKSIQRQEQTRRQRAYSMDKKQSKIKLILNKYKPIEEVKVESPTYRIGKRYLQQSGRIKKRVKTESSQYYELTQQQRYQLDKIRQKIDMLTKSMKS